MADGGKWKEVENDRGSATCVWATSGAWPGKGGKALWQGGIKKIRRWDWRRHHHDGPSSGGQHLHYIMKKRLYSPKNAQKNPTQTLLYFLNIGSLMFLFVAASSHYYFFFFSPNPIIRKYKNQYKGYNHQIVEERKKDHMISHNTIAQISILTLCLLVQH